MKSLKTLMYNGIKYFFCLLYTNSLLHFCASDASPVTGIPTELRYVQLGGALAQLPQSLQRYDKS